MGQIKLITCKVVNLLEGTMVGLLILLYLQLIVKGLDVSLNIFEAGAVSAIFHNLKIFIGHLMTHM